MRTAVFLVATLAVFTAAVPAAAQYRVLAGRVIDATTKQPIPLGDVVVKGGSERDRLRPDGVFVLHVRAGRLTLVVQAEGYLEREIEVLPDQEAVEIALRPVPPPDATVASDDLARVPATGLEQALQGKLAGVDATANSGAPADLQLRLRGVTTILGNSRPLWVLDGVVLSDAGPASGVSMVTGAPANIPSRIADLNPNDIASIEVLRGASATAMYGSRGGAGVVIVRTKRRRPRR